MNNLKYSPHTTSISNILEQTATWQCVMLCWGSKYSIALIANLITHIKQYSQKTAHFVLITDAIKPELSVIANVTQVLLPEYFNQNLFKAAGCQAKLAMFERGILPTDLPAIYIDLDTVVLGDLSTALQYLDTPKTIALFQSAILPFGKTSRTIARLSHKRYYARGNSSIVVFQPSQCYYIAEQFKWYCQQHQCLEQQQFVFKPLRADERFISWTAQNTVRALPNTFAVKFPTEFMFPFKAWLYIRAKLPWMIRRRQSLVAITLNGLDIKPEKLQSLKDGDVITDHKQRYLIWSNSVMGVSKQKILKFYQAINV
ncbi:MAG: hypothetical protein RI956_462 [Pseudomonadota bacterium]|jgi:hypothetical protein